MDRGFFLSTKRPTGSGKLDADFETIRSVQILTDKLRRLIHILRLNGNVCSRLQGFFHRLALQSPPEMIPYFGQCENMFDSFRFQTETHILQLESVLSRVLGIRSLVGAVSVKSLLRCLTWDSSDWTGPRSSD